MHALFLSPSLEEPSSAMSGGTAATPAAPVAPTACSASSRITNVSQPRLTVFRPELATDTQTALIVAPGGAFHFVSKLVDVWCLAASTPAFPFDCRPSGRCTEGQVVAACLNRGSKNSAMTT
jgi:hypothetical protein